MSKRQFSALFAAAIAAAFFGSVIGASYLSPRSASAQTAPVGNGGTPPCDGTSITCSGGTISLNVSHANTWTGVQTFYNGQYINIIDQIGANNFAGSCTMTTTSCTITLSHNYTNPLCFALAQGSSAIAGACSVSGTIVTITAASSNTLTWAAVVIGNPT